MRLSPAVYIPTCSQRVRPSVHDRIAAFLDGRTNGEELLHKLYDHVLDEPIPEAMRRLFEQ